MYLDHTFDFAQRIGSAKVKSKSEVAQCLQPFNATNLHFRRQR